MNFLDILILKSDTGLSTTLYRKPTDRNSLLHGQSYHPTPLKRSLPVAQMNRIRRICSTDSEFHIHKQDLENRFLQRGHKKEWVTHASDRVSNITQSDCLDTARTKSADDRITCVFPYSPLSKNMSSIVHKHWHIISTDPSLRGRFKDPPRVAFRRPPNLRNMLVRADNPNPPPPRVSFLPPVEAGNYKCGNCQQCNFTRKTKTFYHPHTGKVFSVKGVISCKTNNVIYMLKCPCGLAYIGKTSETT